MFTINEGLIGQGHGGVPKSLQTRYCAFATGYKEILVVRKGSVHCIPYQTFGDGMQLIHLTPGPFLIRPVREACLIQGAMIYQEYDETADSWSAYAYQFPKDQELIEEITSLLPESTHLVVGEKFVQIVTTQKHISADKLKVFLQQNGKRGVLSFLYGMGLIYGSWTGEGESYTIRIPYRGSVIQHEATLQRVQQRCATKQYMILWSYPTTGQGQWCEIVIDDWEILEQFASWQGVQGPLPGRERSVYYKEKLLNYLKLESTPGDTMQLIRDGVLKLWKK